MAEDNAVALLIADLVAAEVKAQLEAAMSAPRYSAEERDKLLNTVMPSIKDILANTVSQVDMSLTVAEGRIASMVQELQFKVDDATKGATALYSNQNALSKQVSDFEHRIQLLENELRSVRDLAALTRRRDVAR